MVVKNYRQLSDLFSPNKYDGLGISLADSIRKRAENKRALLAQSSTASLEIGDNLKSPTVQTRFAIDMSSKRVPKHKFPGIRPSKSEQLLTKKSPYPDLGLVFDNSTVRKPPVLVRLRDKSYEKPLRQRNNLLEMNIFRK